MARESALVTSQLARHTAGSSDPGPDADVCPAGPTTPSQDQRLLQLFEQHYEFVWRSLRRLGIPAANVEDGAQRVFMILSTKLSMVEPGREVSFLYGTARRVASDMRETARLEQGRRDDLDPELASEPFEQPDALLERKQARQQLDHILDELDFDLRSVFVLFELEGFRTGEVADMLALPQGTVASRLRKARELVLERVHFLEQHLRGES